jgi:HK97 family phage prohead protease
LDKEEDMHKYKEFALIKSADDAGTISGYFSTYDRIPDSYGDVIARGAFIETIQKRKESGHPFPLCWNHDLNQIIGFVDPADIEDTEKGPLMKKASFFNTPLAQEKREIVKSGVVYQFSFAYEVLEAGPTTLDDGVKANELKKLELFEVSIVPIPANPRAEVTDIKSEVATATVKIVPEVDVEALRKAMADMPLEVLDVKAGRRNSSKDATTIKQIISLAQSLLDEENEADDPEDGEDDVKANGAPEEPERSNPEKERLLNFIKTISEKKEN